MVRYLLKVRLDYNKNNSYTFNLVLSSSPKCLLQLMGMIPPPVFLQEVKSEFHLSLWEFCY